MRPHRARSSGRGRHVVRLSLGFFVWSAACGSGAARGDDPPSNAEKCARIVHADVVALDQCLIYNRYGTAVPTGMIYALRRDVVSSVDPDQKDPQPGAVVLRDGKRPRPIVLRANEGDCLEIRFTNLLSKDNPNNANPSFLKTRAASVHVQGLEVVDSLSDDGSWVGRNNTQASLVQPGDSVTYRLFARKEGAYYLFSQGVAMGNPSQLSNGLFGMVVVEPRESTWYRSQVTRAELAAAQAPGVWGPHGHPVIDYDALDAGGIPVLKMLKPMPSLANGRLAAFELCRSDLTAIIAGPDEPGEDRWLFRHPGQAPGDNPLYPRSWEPFREFAIIYHDLIGLPLASPFDFGTLKATMGNGNEVFAINYGSVAIGTEIWSNRMKVGPAWDALDAKFEEFFLSSWVGGDPALIVDVPANAPKAAAATPAGPKARPDCPPPGPTPQAQLQTGPKATAAFYPDDPSNVYHSYLNDRVRFRVMHGGANVLHVHHQHAHQWLRTPAGDESKLLDSQSITPGDGFTLEMIYGSGNRNLTPGDSIFHCHFYPHFASGLWALWRVHDVFESGTSMERGDDGIERPAPGSRALPDGEIACGTPIPALVPMPAMPMAPVPPEVRIAAAPPAGREGDAPAATVPPSRRVELAYPERDRGRNPGYPFFIPGIAGRRAPQPPLDFARDPGGLPLDGGLPRHVVLNKASDAELYHQENLFDFSRDFFSLNPDKTISPVPLIAQQLPEEGTPFEQAAMDYHERGEHPTDRPDGSPGEFLTNGGHRRPGAPYADPARNPWNERLRRRSQQGILSGGEVEYLRREDFRDPGGPKSTYTYKVADIQFDVVFNKKGWHYPQQRISSLWQDVGDVLTGRRRPEPLTFRANSGSLVEYWLTNLLPGYYELDDFQVRTPTDMVGQHIHLVKFDVTSSDGAANGFNYQDGSYGPDEVNTRIAAINAGGGLYNFDFSRQDSLSARPTPIFGPTGPGGQSWNGAQTTVQLWYADQLVSTVSPPGEIPARYEDRTLQSVFTHDHFGPSTHQQVGLYAALVVEPRGSSWFDSETAVPLGGRDDGGPTSWQAMIVPQGPRLREPEFREFVLEFQDFQLAYDATSNRFRPYALYPYTFGGGPLPVPPWGWIDSATPGGVTHAIAPPTGTNHQGNPSLISGAPEPGARSINYRSEPIPFRVGITQAEQDLPKAHDPAHDLSQAFRSIERQDPDLNAQPGSEKRVSTGASYPGPFTGADDFDPYTPLLRAYEGDRIHIRALVGAHHEGHSFNIQGVKWPNEPHQPNAGFRGNQVMSISEHFEMNFRMPITPPRPPGSRDSSDYLYQASADINGVPQGLWGLLRSYRTFAPGLANFYGNVPDGRLALRSIETGRYLDPARTPLNVRRYSVVAISAADAQGGNPNALVYYNRGGTTLADPNGLVYVLESDLPRIRAGGAIEPLVLRANAGDLIEVKLTSRLNPKPNGDAFTTAVSFQPRPFAAKSGLQTTTSTQVGLHAALLSYDVNTSNGFNAGLNGGGNGGVQTAAPGQSVTYVWYAGDFRTDEYDRVVPRPVELGTVGLAPSDPIFQHPHGLIGVLVVEPEGATWSPTDARTTAQVTVPASGARAGYSFREFVVALQDQTPPAVGAPAVNYRTEPMAQRYGHPISSLTDDLAPAVSNTKVGNVDPQTPIFTAKAGEAVRFRVIHTGGASYWSWGVDGHSWQQSPYRADSTALGHNPLSPQVGTLGPTGPLDQADVLIDSAGGRFAIPGDYLYRNLSAGQLQSGMWGILRVQP